MSSFCKFIREGAQGAVHGRGAEGGERIPLTSTPSQKQSRQQLDKRYLSIRKTMSTNSKGATSAAGKFNHTIFDRVETESSLAAAMISSSISPERQRQLLIKVPMQP